MSVCVSRGVVLVALSALGRAGQVWVVDKTGGPGADFTEIQAAVAAAADGDSILVRPPPSGQSYASFTVDGKGLVVCLSDETVLASGPQYFPQAIVKNVAAPRAFALRGFRLKPPFAGPFGFKGQALEVRDCSGDVWIENSSFHQGVVVANSAAVLLSRCTVTGTTGADACIAMPGGTGMLVQASSVHLYDSQIRGGFGGNSFFTISCLPAVAGTGGTALRMEDGFLFTSGSLVQGGAGGGVVQPLGGACVSGASGGDGLVLASGAPLADLLDTQLDGGTTGCSSVVSGSAVIVSAGAYQTLAGPSRSLALRSPVKEGGTLAISISAEPGDLAFWGLSAAQDQLYLPPFAGVLALANPIAVAFAGAVPASGTLAASVPIGELGPGVEGRVSYFQGGFLTGTSEIRLGSPSLALLLDQAF